MSAHTIARAALAAAAVLLAVILFGGARHPYTLQLRMASAAGLKDGSPVTIGGVRIGKVDVDVDTRSDQAVAELRIEDRYAPLGRDTRAAIVAQNLLGQKQVQLTKGSAADPAPSGFAIPADRITEATDLDRVLSVLDADTRTRLAIFINEAGTAFTGRRADFNRFLRDIGPAIHNATGVVGQLAADNRALGRLVETSDRYVAEVTRRRHDVVRLVDRLGEAARTGATKRAQLRATLARAPGGLRALRGFLRELRATTVPLRPAARRLSAAARPLRGTLDALEPFRASAAPALRTAVAVAPALERLAAGATPVLRRTAPTAAALRRFSAEDLPPVLSVSDRSLNNTLAVIQNWAGAIQFRDGLGHIFRGEASFAPDALESAIRRLSPTRRRAHPRRERPASPRLAKAPALPKVGGIVNQALKDLPGVIDGLVKQPGGTTLEQQANDLLDLLLG